MFSISHFSYIFGSRLYVDPETIAKADEDDFALTFARIESHYFINGGYYHAIQKQR